ncbi:MAG: hypothetical protein ACLT5P_07410 [Flavonifractor plautii]
MAADGLGFAPSSAACAKFYRGSREALVVRPSLAAWLGSPPGPVKGQGRRRPRFPGRLRPGQVRDIALCTFRWFVTLTLDPARANRHKSGGHLAPQPLAGQQVRRSTAYVLVGGTRTGYPLRLLQRRAGGRDSGLSPARPESLQEPRSARQRAKWQEDGKPVYNSRLVLGFDGHELYGEYDRAVSYVCKYIGKELAPSPNGDGLEPQKIGGRWYYSGGALGRPQVTYAELDFRQAEQEPGAYRFDLPQAGISFVQFQFQAKGGENSGEPVGKVAGSQSEVPGGSCATAAAAGPASRPARSAGRRPVRR